MKYVVGLLVICVGFLLFWMLRSQPETFETLVLEARKSLKKQDLDAAEAFLADALEQQPDSGKALLLAAEVDMRREQWEPALETLRKVSNDQPEFALALFTKGEIERSRFHLSKAEKAFVECLEVDSHFVQAHQRLAELKRLSGRAHAADQHLQVLLPLGQLSSDQLAWLAAPDKLVKAGDFLETAHDAQPNDPVVLYGLGSMALKHGDLEQAERKLRKGLAIQFDAEIMAQLGLCLFTNGDSHVLDRWGNSIPTEAQADPEIQYVFGLIAEMRDKPEVASRHLVACIKTLPYHKGALTHLSTVLNQTENSQTESLLEVVELLSELESIMGAIQPHNPHPLAAIETSNVMQKLGRSQEAIAWAALAGQSVDASSPIASIGQVSKLIHKLPAETKWVLAGKQPPGDRSSADVKPRAVIHFEDVGEELGLDFQYFESPDPTTEGNRMFEFTGGGVGVLDYDMDGQADLYFTQGAEWPVDAKQSEHLDALYRCVSDQFQRVDGLADISESLYSQGVAIGDMNNDGFQDIYVANFGPNQLFINNGDGTFSDESANFPADPEWTTSCVMADLNGDGNPDIYDVNYLHGEGVDSKICETKAGPRACSPLAFKATNDRLLLSDGQSSLRDSTEEMGMLKPGNGLGVVAANFDTDAELELFVANDLMKNFLWDLQDGKGTQSFEDVSLINGWAFSSEGDSQACMGIAAADFNGDSTTDLFVTNFFNESNTLYLSDETGFAQDRSSVFGIRGPSLPMLGFGTQAIDADLDGDFDLFVVNGDLDDYSYEDRSLLMPPQFFENIENKRFEEHSSMYAAEGYLAGEYRGRGMAKVDYNRDGLWDLAITHLDSPVALVKNATATDKKAVRVKLVGTKSSRDAIGAVVTVKSGDRTQSQSLTAGDGYQASNEKLLIFPVLAETPVSIEIQWPSGMIDQWEDIVGSSTFVAVEGLGTYSVR